MEAYCGSCKDSRWHIVVAMVGEVPAKVECVSCHKQHGYRTGPAGTGKAARTSVKKRAAAPQAPTFDLSALQSRAHLARAYAPAQTYAVGDVVRHPTFGLGIVTGTAAAQKMDVRFESGPRLLVHDRKPAG